MPRPEPRGGDPAGGSGGSGPLPRLPETVVRASGGPGAGVDPRALVPPASPLQPVAPDPGVRGSGAWATSTCFLKGEKKVETLGQDLTSQFSFPQNPQVSAESFFTLILVDQFRK